MSRILIVEDDEILRAQLCRAFVRANYEVVEAASVPMAERDHDLASVDLVLTDLNFLASPDRMGTDLIARAAPTPVIVMTAYGTVQNAVAAMRQGAADFVEKPFSPEEILLVISRVLEQARQRRQVVALQADVARTFPVEGMIGSSARMREVFATITKVALTEARVLIRGESGTGKELVARALHARSARRNGPFIAVNCAAIPDSLIESELFGHKKGAFTGATEDKTGLIEAAAGGMLFLDEIGELPLAAQPRLLRVIEDLRIRRIGETHDRRVDVRVVAATHRDLARMAREGTFRNDLLHRICVVDLALPPLRERDDDVLELARALLASTAAHLGVTDLTLTEDALAAITAYHWPGNVRELANAIERGAILCDTGKITAELLGLEPSPPGPSVAGQHESLDDTFCRLVRERERELSETELARSLGISRTALWRRRQRLGLPRPPRPRQRPSSP